MNGNVFDELTEVFDGLIDWPKRLAHEGAFHREVFDRLGARRVLDAACGTGRHAAMFHSWGLQVEGADLSPRMIALARARFGDPPGLSWAVRGFDEPAGPPGAFDAAVCVGNSLALAPDVAAAGRALRALLTAVRDGGAVVVHVLNLWSLPDGPCVWQRSARAALPQGDLLIARGVHRSGPRGFVELIAADPAGKTPLVGRSAPLLAFEAAQLEQAALDAGARQVAVLGGYRGEPYERDRSVDLLIVAEK